MTIIYGPWNESDWQRIDNDREAIQMSENREAAVAFLSDKVRINSGQKSEAQTAREHAVAVLAGKAQVSEPIRPEVKELLGRDR